MLSKLRLRLPFSVSAALAELVMRCLEKRPADRPQSAGEIVHALDNITTPSGGMEPASASGVATPRTGSRWPAIAIASVIIALVAGASVFALRHRVTESATTAKSVAVLPIVNGTGDTAITYFIEGMTDELTGVLGRVPGLRVASLSAATSIDTRKPIDSRTVGQRLNVGALLEGRVRREGGKLRITMELVDVVDALSLWTDSFNGDIEDAFKVQNDIAHAVATALSVTYAGNMPVKPGTANADAHDLVLRGRYQLDLYTDSSFRHAISLFKRATQLDPNYVDAWALMADAWARLADDFMLARDAIGPLRAALDRALVLDSTNLSALVERGLLQGSYARDFTAAERDFVRVLRADSTNELAADYYAFLLTIRGQMDSAAAILLRLEHNNPLSQSLLRDGPGLLVRAGHVAQANKVCERAIELDARAYTGCRRVIFYQTGRFAEALAECRKLAPPPSRCGATALAGLGRTAEARREALAVEAKTKGHYVRPGSMATMWAAVGDPDRAMAWLDVSEKDGGGDLSALTWSYWDPIRADPRFQALVKRVLIK